MKSALQIQLDNQYEIMRVVYLRRKEQAVPVRKLSVKLLLHRPLQNVPANEVRQPASWDAAWFNHYE